MRNPSIYVGMVMVSDEADGHKRVSTFDGLCYHGLDDLQATVIQEILVEEFAEEFDVLKQKLRKKLVALGYASAEANGADMGKLGGKENGLIKSR